MRKIDAADRFVVRRNDWESVFFGREIWTCAAFAFEGRTFVECTRDAADVHLWECRLPVSESSTIEQLVRAGFFVCDSSCDFTFDLSQPDTYPEAATIAEQGFHVASADEIPDIEALIGEESFSTRFGRSPFSPAEGARFYRAWARNAVLGEFDDLCCVAMRDGKIAGFVTLRNITPAESRIGLIYTSPGSRGRGVAHSLIVRAAGIARQRGSITLRMATQMNNQSALSLGNRMNGAVSGLYLHMYRVKGRLTL